MGCLIAAIRRFVRRLYPALQPRLTKQQRDVLIRARHTAGEALSDLAREFGISPQRAWQIVKDVS